MLEGEGLLNFHFILSTSDNAYIPYIEAFATCNKANNGLICWRHFRQAEQESPTMAARGLNQLHNGRRAV